MVTIKKGNHKLTVSKETYINMFKELGYEMVTKSEDKNKNRNKKNETTSTKEKEKVEEEKKSQIDEFLDNVCDETKVEEEKEVTDILSIMSKDKNKQNKK